MSNKRRYGLRGRAPRSKASPKVALGAHRPGEQEGTRSVTQAGAINAYACPKCEKLTVVMHRDPGVTPMFLKCRMTEDCGGAAYSLGYPPNPPLRVVNAVKFIWYRPSTSAYEALSPEMKKHVGRGGLVLAPLSEVPED